MGLDTTSASLVINFYESSRALGSYLAESGAGVSFEQLAKMVASVDVQTLLALAEKAAIPEPIYSAVVKSVETRIKRAYVDYVMSNNLDAVLMPTSPVASLEQNAVTVDVNGNDVFVFEAFFALGHYTPLVGAPTVTIPIGKKRSRTPGAGIDIAGLPGDDRRILAIAAAIEKVVPSVRPPWRIRPLPLW